MIHIYVSMAGFTLALLFGVTGLTLNHEDFGISDPRTERSEISLDKNLVDNPDQGTLEQRLHQKLGIRSPSTDYHEDPDQIQITFAAPGTRTIVTINRLDGKGEVEKETRGFLGKLGDLHKGFDSGAVWYWTIDVAAMLIVISSFTGIVTLLALRARRRTGFAVGALGMLTVIAIYVIWVPK
jgi:hypothetical protein